MNAKNIIIAVALCIATGFSCLAANTNTTTDDNEAAKYADSYNFARAKDLLEKEDFDGAVASLKKEVAVHPDNTWAWYYLGTIANNSYEEEEAITDFTNAIKYCDPKHADDKACYYISRADVYNSLGKTDEAEKDYSAAVAASPNKAFTYYSRCIFYINTKNYEKAMPDVDKAIELAPEEMDGYTAKAFILKIQGKYDEAMSCVEKSAPHDTTGYFTNLLKGDLYYNMDKFDEAFDNFIIAVDKSAEKQDYDNYMCAFENINALADTVYDAITGKIEALCAANPTNKDYAMLATYVFRNNSKWEKAIEYLEKYYKINPLPTIFANISECYEYLGEMKKAEEYIDKAIAASPEESANYYKKADMRFQNYDLDGAIQALSKSIALHPDDTEMISSRASYHYYNKDYQSAYNDYKQICRIDTVDNTSTFDEANTCKMLGKTEEATSVFKSCLDEAKETGDSTNMAYAYIGLGDIAMAKKIADELAKDDNTNLYDLTCIYALLNDKQNALKHLETTLESGYDNFALIHYDADLDNIRETPEFKALIEKYKANSQQKP